MAKRLVLAAVTLALLVLMVGSTATAGSLFDRATMKYRVGDAVLFRVETRKSCCCCCCSCADTEVLGWQVVDACGQLVHTMEYDPPGLSSTWEGTWTQIDLSGTQVPSGYYKLYVDTSAGTISRCFKIYNPCSCCCWSSCWCRDLCSWWSRCSCRENPTIKHCCCRVSLELVAETGTCCLSSCWLGCSPCR